MKPTTTRVARLCARQLLLSALALAPLSLGAQQLPPVSVSFEGTRMQEVLSFFADFAGRSIVSGTGVDGVVTAEIDRQPWDQALAAILSAHGFVGRELQNGIIIVENPASVVDAPTPLTTRVFRLSYVPAPELQSAVASVLSKRGTVSSIVSLNALVVTDEPRVIETVADLLGHP